MTDTGEMSGYEELFAPLEAILMVAPEPVDVGDLAEALHVNPQTVHDALCALSASYRGENGQRTAGFELRQTGGAWRIYSARRWASLVGRFIVGSAQSRLSQAALETLAVVAYRQPISRSRISHIRGVNVDAVMRTLVARGLIEEVGETDSGAHLYGTTREFLEKMGFKSLDDLVPLAPYLPDSDELDELEEQL
ncbi:MAG: SMC-Scp complex subunit ScpB [Schaalia turicensis]